MSKSKFFGPTEYVLVSFSIYLKMSQEDISYVYNFTFLKRSFLSGEYIISADKN